MSLLLKLPHLRRLSTQSPRDLATISPRSRRTSTRDCDLGLTSDAFRLLAASAWGSSAKSGKSAAVVVPALTGARLPLFVSLEKDCRAGPLARAGRIAPGRFKVSHCCIGGVSLIYESLELRLKFQRVRQNFC
eukprot:6197892-Pleurochrysis_carterae.AAC.1